MTREVQNVLSKSDWDNIFRDSQMFMKVESIILMGAIQARFYTRRAGKTGLNTRTGRARGGWEAVTTKKNFGSKAQYVESIGNPVEYSDFSKEKVIKPKRRQFLAIPLPNVLTPAGEHRFSGPRDPAHGETFVLGGVIYGDQGALYALKKEVRVPAYTKGLNKYMEGATAGLMEKFSRQVLHQIDKAHKRAL